MQLCLQSIWVQLFAMELFTPSDAKYLQTTMKNITNANARCDDAPRFSQFINGYGYAVGLNIFGFVLPRKNYLQ